MKYLILADWHYDFWQQAGRDPFAGLEDDIASLDLLILAGDISNKPKVRWKHAFAHMSRLLPADRLHVLPGNHDYYQHIFDGDDRLAEIAHAAGVHFSNCSEVRLGDARFLLATLWTDLELPPGRNANEQYIPQLMNDYKLIRVASDGYRSLWPRDVIQRHLEHKRWLGEKLAEPHEGRTVVVTHHAPHPDVLREYGEADAAYVSDLGEFIAEHQPDEWIHGHAHGSRDVEVGGTPIRNCSLGYPWEVPDPTARIRYLIRDTAR